MQAIAQKTLERHTGARGLRSVMENLLTKLMYDVPTDYQIERVTITEDTVKNSAKPELVYNPDREPVKIKMTLPATASAKKKNRRDTA